ncbi:hypothetical protein SELMODRAFT_404055 [Selaginella moellendorffii]|uniref:CID domain-containing protein n=2 Tax=Selaginella moellendorffii TaxID=88036 RepID=D8QU50_SELML|nr:ENHANCER OF AG-4 protein 2 isoform X2 [Selaginella moellendorffii]EFJ36239.1 hypothetical protein SELMODRAFT_404055 [Selaginella moellendorffii]|eukprot:XP_002962776.1 ENHANCER OF AG-4 protein 2 isoform X2 [Selaginella moellendorffii]
MAPSKKRGRSSSIAAAAAAEWSVGDLVLAKVKGFPAWPAQVSKPEAFGQHHNPARVFVVFFGTKQIRFCHHSEISKFTPEAKASLVAKAHSKCTPADLRLAVSEICDVAEKVEVGSGDGDMNGRSGIEFRELEDGEASCVMDLGGKLDVEGQAGNGGTSEMEDYDLGWGSGSSLDGNSDDDTTPKGIVLHEKVQTNFASHEELDTFDSFDFFNEEVVNVPSAVRADKKKAGKAEKPAKQRTPAKSRKSAPVNSTTPVFPPNFCRKKRKQMTVKASTPRGVVRKDDNSDEDHATPPTADEFQEYTFRRKVTLKKRLRPAFESRSAETDSDHNKDKPDTSNETSPITQDPDSNLPIVKRARARAAKEPALDKHSEEEEKRGAPHSPPSSTTDTPTCNGSESTKATEERASDGKPRFEEKYTGLSLPPKAEKYRMRNSLADSEAALPPSKRLHRALEAMTACVAEAAKEETARDAKVEETPDNVSQKSDSTEQTRLSEGVVVKNCVADDADKLQEVTVTSKEFVDKEMDPASVGLGSEDLQQSEVLSVTSIQVSVKAEATQDTPVSPAVQEVVEVAEELVVKAESAISSQAKVQASPSGNTLGEDRRDVETGPPSDAGGTQNVTVVDNPEDRTPNPEDRTPLSSALSPVSMDLSEGKSDVKAGVLEFESKSDELQSTAENSEAKTPSMADMKYSPVSPRADDGQIARFHAESLVRRDEPVSKGRLSIDGQGAPKERRQPEKNSPSAWWGRSSHLSKFHRGEDKRKLENHFEVSLYRKDGALAKTALERLQSMSPAKISPGSMRYSPVSPALREEGNKVLFDHAVTVKSSREGGTKVQLEKLDTSGRGSRHSSKPGISETSPGTTKARGLSTDKPKTSNSKMRRHSPVRHGTETSSLVSERGTTESHSGESLASENEHTSARTSSLRTKAAGHQDSFKLNDISASKPHSDNNVRKAYEAAKELKQKLASKDGDTSTSMKYIMAAVQSKVPGPVTPMDVGTGPEIVMEQASGASKDLPSLPTANDEAETARNVFEGLLDNLSRAKESIHCATRQAIDCAKLNLADQVIDIIAKRLEAEQSLSRRIDLFFLVDSITVSSHNLRGTPAGVYRHIVHNALPRLLSSAAPPGNFARENRRQCLKVFKLWHERNVFPPTVIRHFMREIELHNCDRVLMNMSRRPARNERPVDDPIREMEGMQVDEYGSNASFTLPGVSIPRMFEDEEEANAGGTEANAGEDYAVATVTPHDPVERHRHVLEDVDGELEMEDVSPETDTWQRQYVSPASILTGPPLPICPPPSPPPLPSSPPPSTPPPPPPSSPPPPPQDVADPGAYPDSFSPGYHHARNAVQQPSNGPESYEHYNPGVYGDEGYGMPVDHGYNSYGGFSDMPPGPISPQYDGHHGHHYGGQHYPADGHSYQGDYPYQAYGEAGGHWSEPSPRSRYMHSAPDDHYYHSHHDNRYGDHGADYYHQNGPHYMQSHYDGGYSSHGRYSSGYMTPPPDHQMHHGSSGRSSRRHGHYSHDAGGGYSHDYGGHDGGGYSRSHSHSHSHDGGGGGYQHSHSHSHDGGGGGYSHSHPHHDGYSHYPNW